MNNQTRASARKASKKGAAGIKAMIMAASIGITLGGWGVLAAGQAVQAAAPLSQSSTVSANSLNNTQSNSSTNLSQSVPFFSQPGAIARTRSSR